MIYHHLFSPSLKNKPFMQHPQMMKHINRPLISNTKVNLRPDLLQNIKSQGLLHYLERKKDLKQK